MFSWLRAIVQFTMLRWLMKFTLLLLMAHIAWQNWLQFGLTGTSLPPERQQLAHVAILEVTADIARHRGQVQRVVLPPIVGDHSLFVTTRLADQLERRGVLAVSRGPFWERAQRWLWGGEPAELTPLQAGRLAMDARADAALVVRIDSFEMNDQTGRLLGSWRLIDPAGTLLHQARFERSNSLRALANGAAAPSLIGMVTPVMPEFDLSGWVISAVLVGFLPLATFSILRHAANDGSNAARALLLGLYSVFSTGLAVLIIGIDIGSRGGLALTLVLLLGTLLYNLWIMSGLVETRQEDTR
ncbi:MAG: hypothetical protein O9325_08770 [Roseomonas sp.]|nr:hypothetical protein [Roseomonas sp.]